MAETPSTMLPLGTKAPTFNLLDTVSGEKKSLDTLRSKTATVILFLCNHCPYVKHIQSRLVEVANQYQARGIQFIAISSNDVNNYPADSPALMTHEAVTHHYPFPYLYDETQAVAKAYQAVCTPDLFVFNGELACVYRGRFDDSTPGNGLPVTGKDLTQALDCLLANQPIAAAQHPSVGCNIKWKK